MLRPIRTPPSTLWDGLEPHLAQRLESLISVCDPTIQQVWRQSIDRPLRLFLRRPSKEFRATLTRFGWSLGRSDPPPEDLPLLVELVHAGSLIMDDVQDGATCRRGEKALHHAVGVPHALNAATSLYLLPFLLLPSLQFRAEVELRLHRRLADAMLACCHGQSLDLGATVDRIPVESLRSFVETATQWKTGGLIGLAAEIGAISAEAPDDVVAEARAMASSIGVGLQMLNDLSELKPPSSSSESFEDLLLRRATWVWVWVAEGATPSDARRFTERLIEATTEEKNSSALRNLAADLNEIVDRRGREEIRRRFQSSLECWRSRFDERYDLEPLLAELGRLERSYAR